MDNPTPQQRQVALNKAFQTLGVSAEDAETILQEQNAINRRIKGNNNNVDPRTQELLRRSSSE